MDVEVNSVDVHEFTLHNIHVGGAGKAWLYLFFASWVIYVASIVSLALNYCRWQKPQNMARKPHQRVRFNVANYVEHKDDE